MTDRELMKQALEGWDGPAGFPKLCKAMEAMRERLALTKQEPDAYGYASRLAVAIWEQHYKGVAPQWKPLDDLMGVLTQIDNMTAGLTAPTAAPVQEPRHTVQSNGRHSPLLTHMMNSRNTPPAQPAQRQPLTDEEIMQTWEGVIKYAPGEVRLKDFARAIEAAHGIKEKNYG
jgi:hypothetical protein